MSTPSANSKYEIEAVPVKNAIEPLHPWLPSLHMLLVAATGGGKSNLLVNMIYHKREVFPFYKYFKRIHIFSPTAGELDPTWDVIKKDRTGKFTVHDDLDVDIILGVLEQQNELIAIKGKKKVKHHLFIVDDLGFHLKNSANHYFTGLMMRLRHSNVLCWITAQSYRSVPRQLRQQCLYNILFRVSAEEMQVIKTELNGSHDEGLFEQMYEMAVGQPYGFMYVDVRKQRYFASFKNEFVPKRIEAQMKQNAQIAIEQTSDEPTPTPPPTKQQPKDVAPQKHR